MAPLWGLTGVNHKFFEMKKKENIYRYLHLKALVYPSADLGSCMTEAGMGKMAFIISLKGRET